MGGIRTRRHTTFCREEAAEDHALPSIPPPACVSPRWRRIWSPPRPRSRLSCSCQSPGSATEEMLGVSFTTAASQRRMTTAPVPRAPHCTVCTRWRRAMRLLAARCSRARVVEKVTTRSLRAMLLHPCARLGAMMVSWTSRLWKGTSLRHVLSTLLESHTGLGGTIGPTES